MHSFPGSRSIVAPRPVACRGKFDRDCDEFARGRPSVRYLGEREYGRDAGGDECGAVRGATGPAGGAEHAGLDDARGAGDPGVARAQSAARGIAANAPSSVPNGLNVGGLVPDSGLKASGVANPVTTWVGANTPTQTTSGGQTTVNS